MHGPSPTETATAWATSRACPNELITWPGPGVDGVYPSPLVDFDYDITNHCDVDPIFGTLADADWLISAAHDKAPKGFML